MAGAGVPFADPSAAAAHCWQMLVRATRDRKSGWRSPVLSTVGLDGAPRARVIVLRKAEPVAGLLWLHTDARSAKLAELRADPRAALTFWDARRALQLRVEGRAAVDVDAALTADAWAGVPEASRRNYATVEAPGSLCVGEVFHGAPGEANFALIGVRVERLEWLWLGPDRHVRGISRRCDAAWEACALVP